MNIKNGEIINLKQVDSTNSEAQRLLREKKIATPLWIIADEQTSGKGRGEKKWISSKGNLFASLIFPVSFNIKNLPILSCAVSLASRVSPPRSSLLPRLLPLSLLLNSAAGPGCRFCLVHADGARRDLRRHRAGLDATAALSV